MTGIAHAKKRTSCRTALHRALTVSCRIGKLAVISDVINIKTLDTSLETAKRKVLHGRRVDVLSKVYALYPIIISRLAEKQIYTQLAAIKRQGEVLLTLTAGVCQVGRVPQKHPSPSYVRPNLIGWLRRKGDTLSPPVM